MSSFKGMVFLALLLVAPVSAAHGGGFFIKEQSAEGLGRAFAGSTAYASDASVIFYNPAAITQLDEGLVTATGVYGLVIDSAQEDLGTTRTVPMLPAPIPVLGRDGGNPFDPLVPIGNFYVAYPADDEGLWVGLGVNAPFGLSVQYDGDFFGRYDSLKSLLFNINVQPTIAYNLYDNVSIGAGLDIQYADVTLTNALPNLDPALGDGLFRVEGNDWALGWNVGIHADLGDVEIGAHYRSEIDYTLQGFVQIRGLFGPLAPLNGRVAGSAPLELPDMVGMGIVYNKPDYPLRVLFDATWFSWSDFETIRVETVTGSVFETPQNYRDTWAFAVGAEYDLNEQWTVRMGTQFDQTPTRDGFRTTRVPDGDRFWVTAGATCQLSERFRVAFSYAHVFVTTERIDLTESFFEGTPAQIDVNTLSSNSGDADITALSITATF